MGKTINKRKYNYKKLGYSLGLIVLVFTISISIAYAKQIAEIFKSWSTGVEFEDGTKVNIVENLANHTAQQALDKTPLTI